MYLLVPSKNAECNVMPPILNAATPVGAVSNTMTSSGSKVLTPVGAVSNTMTSSGSKVPTV